MEQSINVTILVPVNIDPIRVAQCGSLSAREVPGENAGHVDLPGFQLACSLHLGMHVVLVQKLIKPWSQGP